MASPLRNKRPTFLMLALSAGVLAGCGVKIKPATYDREIYPQAQYVVTLPTLGHDRKKAERIALRQASAHCERIAEGTASGSLAWKAGPFPIQRIWKMPFAC